MSPPRQPTLTNFPATLDSRVASIAREIAQDIRELNQILPDYGFTDIYDPDWQALYASRDFKRALAEATREWNGADSTPKRIRYKAQAAVEQAIPTLYDFVVSGGVPGPERVNAMKVLRDLSGIGTGAGGSGGEGGGFSITINIAKGHTVRADLAPRGRVIEGDAEEVP